MKPAVSSQQLAASSQVINESSEAAMLRRYVHYVEQAVLAAKVNGRGLFGW
jgi:hypothetical protein